MKSIVLVSVLLALTFAEEAAPTQAETTFFSNLATTGPQVAAQYQLFRRLADIYLGLTISGNFQQMAQLEFQKHPKPAAAATPFFEEEAAEEEAPVAEAEDEDAQQADLEEYENAEEDEDDVSLLEMKEEFAPFMMGGMGANPAMTAGKKLSRKDLEHLSAAAKNNAVKAMMVQFFLSAGDVEKSYLVNKMLTMALPPQMSMWKLFKTYLNTVTLSVAFQFQDAFNTEALLDDLNDHIPGTAVSAENRAELQLYSHWHQLVTLKFQLFMFNLYEKMSTGQIPHMANANHAAAASSYLELNEESAPFVGGAANPQAMLMQYAYMNYYVLILKYYALFSEFSIAQSGLSAAMIKVNPKADRKSLKDIEFRALPMAFSQWSSTNQMRYMFEYYLVMMESQIPGVGESLAFDRADNTFQNLVQTEAPATTPEAVKAN